MARRKKTPEVTETEEVVNITVEGVDIPIESTDDMITIPFNRDELYQDDLFEDAPVNMIVTDPVSFTASESGITFAISVLEELASKFDEEARAWSDENAIAKRLREDRASNIRKAIELIQEKYNSSLQY